MSPPRPEFFDASYASLWDLLPQALQLDVSNNGVLAARRIIDTLGQKYNNLSSFRYSSFVKQMIESNAARADVAGKNYRLDKIIDAFARGINDELNPTDFTPITNFLEWNIFDANNSYLDGFANYLHTDTPYKRKSLEQDMSAAIQDNKSFFAVLVLAQIPIQTCLTRYYPENTYTEFVQSVVYAGTYIDANSNKSAIYSDPSGNDGYGIGPDAYGIDPTAFNPYQYNFGNLRIGVDTLPDRIKAIDMWAAATPSKWDAWTANVTGFLSFIGQVFQYHTNNDITDDADLIREFASTGAWNSITTGDPPGFANEFSQWVSGGYNALWTSTQQQQYLQYNLNDIYTDSTYTYDNKSYQLVYEDSNNNNFFVITVITLLRAEINVIKTDASGNIVRDANGNPLFETVTIDQILNAFVSESAPSMFYKGYAPAQYLRKLCYVDGKISFSRLIADGSGNGLRSKLLMDDPSGNALGREFTSLDNVDPYVLLYAENDISLTSLSVPITVGSIFDYKLPESNTFNLTGDLKMDMSAAFPGSSQNAITNLIYNNVYINRIYTYDVSVNGYNFVPDGSNVDAFGNDASGVCLDRGQKIRLDELRTLVGYQPSQLADATSNDLSGNGPFSISDFVAENYSIKNGGPSMKLFDCYSVYGYTLSQIYNTVLTNHKSNNITTTLVDLHNSVGNNAKSGVLSTDRFTDYDLVYYLREKDATQKAVGTKDISGIAQFFPALSYDRIRATFYGTTVGMPPNYTGSYNTSAFNDSSQNFISVDTLTDNGYYLKFLSANDIQVKYYSVTVQSSVRDYLIYGILKNTKRFVLDVSATITDIAYYVLTLPISKLDVSGNDGSGNIGSLNNAFDNASKPTPIELLSTPVRIGGTTNYGYFSELFKYEVNGLYATDSSQNLAPGKLDASWNRLPIDKFLPVASDYRFLLYGTNQGADSINNSADSSNNGIRGILKKLYPSYNPTEIAYLCCALEYSSGNTAKVVPHDIGPNGTIRHNGYSIFTRDEIRALAFPADPPGKLRSYNVADVSGSSVNLTSNGTDASGISPDDLVKISTWENSNSDYVYDRDYALLNITDQFNYDGSNVNIKAILNKINGYDTSNNSVSYKNIAIALNNIYMASNNLTNPTPVALFDGGYYTRDEIRKLFVEATDKYRLTVSALTSAYNTTNNALYKLAYAIDTCDASGFYSTTGNYANMKTLLSSASSDDRIQIIRKMIYSSSFQDASSAYDSRYHAQPWQLVDNFDFSGINVRYSPALTNVPVYVTNTNTSNITLPAVETGILIPYYRNPSLGNYNTTFNHTYTLYELNTKYGLNSSAAPIGEGVSYLAQVIINYIDRSLSPRRIAVELRLGAFDGVNYYTSVNNSYSLADVVKAFASVSPYTGFSKIFITNSNSEVTDPSGNEGLNKQIYINDYKVSRYTAPRLPYYKKKNGTDASDNGITLYDASKTAVTMWSEDDWNRVFPSYTGKELHETFQFTFDEIRNYYYSTDNEVVSPSGSKIYNYPIGKFLTYGTYMKNLLFTRDISGNRNALDNLRSLYNLTNLDQENNELNRTTSAYSLWSDFSANINSYGASNSDSSVTKAILKYAYGDNGTYTKILAEHGSSRVTTLKDVEYMLMDTISNENTSTVYSGNNPVSSDDRGTMTHSFDINTFYNEVITYDPSTNRVVMNVNDFYHYWTRTELRNYTVAVDASGNQTAPSISNVVDTYGTANSNVNFGITIDYFTLNQLYNDTTISLDRIARDYYGANALDLDGKITELNTRHPTGKKLVDASYSIVNVRKLYYNISGDSNYAIATGYASPQYITFKNLVGAVYLEYDPTNDPSGNNIDISNGDYSLVYTQDRNLKLDMSGLTQGNLVAAMRLLIPYSSQGIALNATNVVRTTNETSIGDNIRLDQLRTIVGFTSTEIKTAYDVKDIVSMADSGYIYTQATDNFWNPPASDPYDTKWMTLKVEYGFSAIEIAQNSGTVTGINLLNKTGTKNTGFTAAHTRIGFFYNLRYYNSGNSGTDASNNATDVGFTNYLVDPEFTTSSIAKFAQMVNYGETASMNVQDSVNAYLIPAYSISQSSSASDNVGFYNLFKYLRALNIAYAATKYTNSAYNLFKYMDTSNNTTNGFLYDLNNLESIPNSYSNVYYGNIDPSQFSSSVSQTIDSANAYVKIVMFMRFKLTPPNNIFIKNFYYSYLKTVAISIINDYYTNNAKTAQTLFLQNLFSTADIFDAKTVPELWNGGYGINVKTFVEYYESTGLSQTDIFAKLYPYIPLENLLGYRTYQGTSNTIATDSGQQSSDESGNAKSGVYYYTNPLDSHNPKQRYATGSRWISVKTALEGMDGKWGTQWNSNGGYYSDNNSDAPSIDQVLTALSIIDGNSASTTPSYGIDPGIKNNYSYTTGPYLLTTTTPVIQEIREAYLLTDGSHPAIIGYNVNNSSVNTYPTTDLSGNKPSIAQLVALITGQNIPLGFAKLIFVAAIIIRSPLYTRSEKRGLFASNNNDGGLADAYYQLNQLVSNNYTYIQTPTIVYYMDNHVVEDLISLKFDISAYNNFRYKDFIFGASSSSGATFIPSPGLTSNPFTTYGLLTAYDTNVQGYDEDGFAINVLGQLIWHNAADRTNIIDTFEPVVSEYKYNPASSNSIVNGPYGLDNNGYYFYAYPENITSLQHAYLIEQRNMYKADTRYGIGMSNDPNLNILIALKAIGIPATIALKFPVTAYSPFTNRNIGGDLSGNMYSYIRGTNTQNSISNATYNGGVNRNLLNFTAHDLLSAHNTEQIDSDNLGFVFTSQDHLLWPTLQERDEIIEAFSNTSSNLLKYNPTATNPEDQYAKINGHYYFSYPANLNDFGDLVGSRSTP